MKHLKKLFILLLIAMFITESPATMSYTNFSIRTKEPEIPEMPIVPNSITNPELFMNNSG